MSQKICSVFLSLVIVTVGAGVAQGPATWTQANANWPGIRVNYPLSTDTGRNRILMFGGIENSNTWEWNGSQWLLRSPTTVPAWRHGPSLAYDSVRGEHLMFGGSEYGTFFGETWTWNGTNWNLRSPNTSPSPRRDSLLVYDAQRSTTILYGGSATSSFRDTWSWNGNTWTQLQPQHNPGVLSSSGGYAYDSLRGEILLYGTGAGVNETWVWNGVDWIRRLTTRSPGPRYNVGLAFHPPTGRSYLYGGEYPFGTFLSGTWMWNGSDWTQETTQGSPCAVPPYAAAFDPVNNKMLIFVGHPSSSCGTWLLDPRVPPNGPSASFSSFGTGCAGSGGTPVLTPVANPVVGQAFVVGVSNLPANFGFGFGAIGVSRTAWGFIPLPCDLGFQGMPGCMLYTDPLLVSGFVGSSAGASWSFAIPANYNLLNLQFYLQAMLPDPLVPNPANTTGAVATNALSGLIGY